MSNAFEVQERPVQTDADDTDQRLRHKAEAIVRKAVVSTGNPLQNRGVGHRLLPGIWAATINTLIACLDVRDLIKLLNSRAVTLSSESDNASEPAAEMGDAQRAKYSKDVTLAAQTIVEAVEECIPLLAREGLDDRLPETMLDVAIFLLVKSWGPTHLKRAIVEQVALLLTGTVAPSVFMEPVRIIRQGPPKTETPEPVRPAGEVQPDVVVDRREKTVRMFMDYRLDGAKAEWAVVIHKTSPAGLMELHTLTDRLADENGRTAPIRALVEAMKAISHENPRSDVSVETCHEHVLRGFDGDPEHRSAFRHESEARLWAEFDTLARDRALRFKAVPQNLSETLQHTCDMVMKRGVVHFI